MTIPVSVIVPTTAETRRRESLRRAIDSAHNQRGIATKLILVVNGSHYDPTLIEEFQGFPLHLIRLPEASLPAAIHAGRLAVTSDYFCFLDDDDTYMPDAVACRLDAIESTAADFAVGNGLNPAGKMVIPSISAAESDPLRALSSKNWLASCSGLYRTASISGEFFENVVKYFEWTVIAFRLLMAGKRVCFVDRVTYRISDTEGSASKQKSMESMLNGVAVAEYMFAHVPASIRADYAWKLAATYHEVSDYCLFSNDLSLTWRMHLASIRSGGWQYLAYTRHVLRQTYKAWFCG